MRFKMSPQESLIAKTTVKFLWKVGKNGTWLTPGNWKEGIINLTSERIIIAEGHIWHEIFHNQILNLGSYGKFTPMEGDLADPIVFAEGMDYYLTLIKLPDAIRERFLALSALAIIRGSKKLKVSERGKRFPAYLELNGGGIRLYARKEKGLSHLGIIDSLRPLRSIPEKRVVKTRDEKGERYFLLVGPTPHLDLLLYAMEWARVNPLRRLSELHWRILKELDRSSLTTEKLSQNIGENPLQISKALYDLLFLGLIEMSSTRSHYRLSRRGRLALELT
ncbi:MAG: hypothetical protein J7K08_00900 [Thermoplasmata archaeon]|nr:hypothetical protein [Thermoplasmata archaeon]